MHVIELEELAARLRELRDRLQRTERSGDAVLAEDDTLVQAAGACEFMLPQPLTAATLAETVERKIANVDVLLERARKHEDLPEAAQIAAEQEYTLGEEDYRHDREQLRDQRSEQRPQGR